MSDPTDPGFETSASSAVFVEDLLLTDSFLIKGRITRKSQRLRTMLERVGEDDFLELEDVTMVALVGNETIRTPRVHVALREVVLAHELVEVAVDDGQRRLAAGDKSARIRAFYNGRVQMELTGLIEPQAYVPSHGSARKWFVMSEPRLRGINTAGNAELEILDRLGYAIVRKARLAYVYDFT